MAKKPLYEPHLEGKQIKQVFKEIRHINLTEINYSMEKGISSKIVRFPGTSSLSCLLR